MLLLIVTASVVLIIWLLTRNYSSESIYDGFKEVPSWPLFGNINYFWNSDHDAAMVKMANEDMHGNDAFVYKNMFSSKITDSK